MEDEEKVDLVTLKNVSAEQCVIYGESSDQIARPSSERVPSPLSLQGAPNGHSTPHQSLEYTYDPTKNEHSFTVPPLPPHPPSQEPSTIHINSDERMDPLFTLTSVAFQMAPVSIREASQEFTLVPEGMQPLISLPQNNSPQKSRKGSRRKRKKLSGPRLATPLARMARCKFDEETLDLACEWQVPGGAGCDFHTDDLTAFMAHVSGHIDLDLPIALDINPSNSQGGDGDEEEAETPQLKDYVCLWRGCGHQTPSSDEIVRHVHFHTFHTKLKSHGANVTRETEGLEACQLDSRQVNVLPDLSEPMVCLWQGESCLDQNTTFSEPIKFYRHTQWHSEEYRGEKLESLKCLWKDCSFEVKTVSKLKDHLRVHSQERLVACPTCGGLFANRSKFFDHCKRQVGATATSSAAMPLKCSYCSKRFSTERLLRDHMRAHINQLKCPLCDMSCDRPSSLARHMTYKHFEVKAFPCPKKGCAYKAKTDQDIQSHYRTHFADESYLCPYEDCNYSSKGRQHVKTHIEKVHEGIGPKYLCHLCPGDKRFVRGTYLTNHLLNIHKLRWPSGHSRFRYKRDEETGLYSLQTMRFESADLDQKAADEEDTTDRRQVDDISLNESNLEEEIESVIMDEIAETLHSATDSKV